MSEKPEINHNSPILTPKNITPALLPILRHNSIFLYTDMSTGANLIAPIFHKGQATMEATEQDSNVRDA